MRVYGTVEMSSPNGKEWTLWSHRPLKTIQDTFQSLQSCKTSNLVSPPKHTCRCSTGDMMQESRRRHKPTTTPTPPPGLIFAIDHRLLEESVGQRTTMTMKLCCWRNSEPFPRGPSWTIIHRETTTRTRTTTTREGPWHRYW